MNDEDEFNEDEKLYRAVYPLSEAPRLWTKRGHLSSAVFKDPRGCSVERAKKRTNKEVIKSVKKRLHGCVVSVTVLRCKDVQAYVKYLPSPQNEYHSEIHKNKEEKLLTEGQAIKLARTAKIEYFEE